MSIQTALTLARVLLPDLRPHVVLGQFLGMTELVEKGLVNPTQFTSRCIEIAKEYKASKGEANGE